MDYRKIYDALVEKAKPRGLDKSQHEGYFEIHHITPRCLGGSDCEENLVMFTGREHFIAHMLLWKIYRNNKSLAYAARIMSLRGAEFSRMTSWLYERLKKQTDPRPKRIHSPRFVDKSGLIFGKLTVECLDHWGESWGGRVMPMWRCICECGNTTIVRGQNLNSSGTKSCGCFNGHALASRASKMQQMKPWERSKTPERWTLADYFYNRWEELGKPDSGFKFARLMNKALNKPHYSKTYFNGILPYFNLGWKPHEDEEWCKFRLEFKEE